MQDRQKLAEILKSELTFLEQGGYRRRPRYPWRPNFIFEDSPTCINFRHGCIDMEKRPCGECHLIDLVPLERRNAQFPCRHIDLTEAGDTVNSFYEYGTQDELETALGDWLRQKIRELENESRVRAAAA